MVRANEGYIGICGIMVVNQPNFLSPSTRLECRVVGTNGLCFDNSPLYSSFLYTNLCTSFEHWVVLADGLALVDSRENALKYCRKKLLWEYYRDEKLMPFKQNMPVYGWVCRMAYQKALAQLRELKL